MLATGLLTYAALNAAIGLGTGDMRCGFPAMSETQPALVMSVAPGRPSSDRPDRLPVRMALSMGSSSVGIAAVAQPMGPADAPFVVIAGSPAANIVLQLGLKDDGSASLTIRDLRRGAVKESRTTRVGHCADQDGFFMLFDTF